jgi:hypothetical protein
MKRICIGIVVCVLAQVGLANVSKPTSGSVKALTKKMADWQIATFHEHGKYRALAGNKVTQKRNRKNKHDGVHPGDGQHLVHRG